MPAYFDPEQREATIAAGKLAGLETVKLIRCCSDTDRNAIRMQSLSEGNAETISPLFSDFEHPAAVCCYSSTTILGQVYPPRNFN